METYTIFYNNNSIRYVFFYKHYHKFNDLNIKDNLIPVLRSIINTDNKFIIHVNKSNIEHIFNSVECNDFIISNLNNLIKFDIGNVLKDNNFIIYTSGIFICKEFDLEITINDRNYSIDCVSIKI